jgi:hypothetical protein
MGIHIQPAQIHAVYTGPNAIGVEALRNVTSELQADAKAKPVRGLEGKKNMDVTRQRAAEVRQGVKRAQDKGRRAFQDSSRNLRAMLLGVGTLIDIEA